MSLKPYNRLPSHLRRGRDAEQAGSHYLSRHGLREVVRNYRAKVGEIDLIMQEGEELVFVEVRYRNSEQFGGAIESVNRDKQRKLRRAAEQYLQQRGPDYESCRFDVLAIHGQAPNFRIEWIRDAF